MKKRPHGLEQGDLWDNYAGIYNVELPGRGACHETGMRGPGGWLWPLSWKMTNLWVGDHRQSRRDNLKGVSKTMRDRHSVRLRKQAQDATLSAWNRGVNTIWPSSLGVPKHTQPRNRRRDECENWNRRKPSTPSSTPPHSACTVFHRCPQPIETPLPQKSLKMSFTLALPKMSKPLKKIIKPRFWFPGTCLCLFKAKPSSSSNQVSSELNKPLCNSFKSLSIVDSIINKIINSSFGLLTTSCAARWREQWQLVYSVLTAH